MPERLRRSIMQRAVPNLAEAEAVRRVLYLAKLAGDAPVYIVHLSCKESLEAVEEARRNGQKTFLLRHVHSI